MTYTQFMSSLLLMSAIFSVVLSATHVRAEDHFSPHHISENLHSVEDIIGSKQKTIGIVIVKSEIKE